MTAGRVRRRHRSGIATVAVIAALAIGLAACGSDEDEGATDTTTADTKASTDTTSGAALTDLGHGVTADKIKLGIVIVDYTAIADFVDFARGDQEKTAKIFVDDINANGGIGGRMIDPVYLSYPPLPGREPSPLAVCTQLTEDEDVFAVLGVFIDFTGDGQLCLSRDHETIHIGHELEQTWIDEAPPGLLLTPDTTKELAATTLITLLDEEGTLEGKTAAILADQDGEARANDVIGPALEEAGVTLGSTAILSVIDEDTSAAQAQLDSFIEKWKTENVDTIFMAGLKISAKQFVQKIKAAMPDVLLITDASSTAAQGQDLVAAGTTPNPYTDMLGVEGATDSERWNNKSPLLQQCVDTYEKASGETVLGPDEVTPGPDGKTQEVYIAVTDFCDELVFFKTVAEKVGPELTNDNWTKTVDSFGPIDLVSTDIASLCKGKYAADDAARIVKFDPTVGEKGNWAPVTDVADASGGKCK